MHAAERKTQTGDVAHMRKVSASIAEPGLWQSTNHVLMVAPTAFSCPGQPLHACWGWLWASRVWQI